MRLLLENLADDFGATRALVFGVLTEMLKQEQLIPCFQGYTELIILKVLESHRDTEKDVSIFLLKQLVKTTAHLISTDSRLFISHFYNSSG